MSSILFIIPDMLFPNKESSTTVSFGSNTDINLKGKFKPEQASDLKGLDFFYLPGWFEDDDTSSIGQTKTTS